MEYSSEILINAHIKANLGVFFDLESFLSDDIRYLYSSKIKDFYWNFCVKKGGDAPSELEQKMILNTTTKHNKQPTIWTRTNTFLSNC